MTGAALLLAVAALAGVLFAWIAGASAANLVLPGAAYGAFVWAVVQFVALPIADPAMAAAVSPVVLLLYHLVYGAALGSYLTERRAAWRVAGQL
ncbi:MAG: hypothetical protein HY321_02400 [Armatimonadetes bacterium]|nr:hypothetical protein [Armatimonadota bacterium]